MAVFKVMTAYTDGWRCETHRITARSIDEACCRAIALAGAAGESWTSCEPGEPIVDAVAEVKNGKCLSHPVTAMYREAPDVRKIMRQRDALAKILENILNRDLSDVPVRLQKKALQALNQLCIDKS